MSNGGTGPLGGAWVAGLSVIFAGLAAAGPIGDVPALLERGEVRLAEERLRAVPAPAPPVVDYLLGLILLRQQRYDPAVDRLTRALEARPGRPRWLHALARAHFEAGRAEAALARLDEALLVEDRPELRFDRAMCLEATGSTRAAMEALRSLVATRPDHVRALVALGRLLVRFGEADDARPILERATRLAPDDLEARVQLGLAREAAGDDESAVATWREILSMRPDHPVAIYRLARSLLGSEEDAEGRRLIERYRDVRKREDRIEQLTEAARLDPESEDIRLTLAETLSSAGRREDARAVVDVLVARGLEDTRLDQLRERLAGEE